MALFTVGGMTGLFLAALSIFAGFFLTFLPQFALGYQGTPRRYHAYHPQYH